MINFKEFNKYFFAFFLAIILFLLIVKSCNTERQKQELSDRIDLLQNENYSLKQWKDEQGKQVSKQEVTILNDDNGLVDNEKIDKLETKIIFKTTTKFDTLTVLLKDTLIYTEHDTVHIQNFLYSDNWISMAGKIHDENIKFDSLKINNNFSIEIGTEKKWFLGKKTKTIYILNDNPYTETDKITSIVIQDNKKWFERKPLFFVAGGLATFLLLK